MVSVLLFHEEFTTTHAILFAFVWSGLALYLLAGFLKNREQRKENTLCE
jgi:chloramphenicol-sensitive protein RarD